jgi:hypothetical protein
MKGVPTIRRRVPRSLREWDQRQTASREECAADRRSLHRLLHHSKDHEALESPCRRGSEHAAKDGGLDSAGLKDAKLASLLHPTDEDLSAGTPVAAWQARKSAPRSSFHADTKAHSLCRFCIL